MVSCVWHSNPMDCSTPGLLKLLRVKSLSQEKQLFSCEWWWMLIRFVTILQYLQICSHYVIHLKITLYVSHTSAFLKKKKIKKEISQISLSLCLIHTHTNTHTHTNYCLGAIAETCISKTKIMESQNNTGYCSRSKIRIVLRKNLEFDGLCEMLLQ